LEDIAERHPLGSQVTTQCGWAAAGKPSYFLDRPFVSRIIMDKAAQPKTQTLWLRGLEVKTTLMQPKQNFL